MGASYQEMINTPLDVILRDLEYNNIEQSAKELKQKEINNA